MRKHLVVMMCIIMAVCLIPAVAMAEGDTLPTAIDGVITLSEDVVLSESWTIDSSETFVLNLNGYSIKFINAGVGIKNDGKLTINDTEGGRVFTTDVAAQGRATIANYGTLEINGGTFGDYDIDRSNPNGVNRGNALRNYGTATINGGYFTACDNYTNGGYAYAIANGSSSYNDAQMTINNATVYGKMNGVIASDGGTLIVKNGSFTLGDGTSSNNYYMAYTSGEGKIKVEGGTFERNVNNNYVFFYEDDSTSEIIATGGTFSSDVSAYVPEGTQMVDNGDGKYSLAPADNAVAQIGVAGYATLQAAIASATNGQTVTLLKDVPMSSAQTIDKRLTIDLNQKTLTGANNAFVFYTTADVTIKNGEIQAPYGGIRPSDGKLLLQDVDITGSDSLISVNKNAQVTIDKDSVITATGNVNYPAVQITGQYDTSGGYNPYLYVYGTIHSNHAPAILGNGRDKDPSHIYIYDGADIQSGKLAMYLPQICDVNISGGTIKGKAAIGIKSGTLNITGGKIWGTANDTVLGDEHSQSNGIASDGSAIVIDSYVGYAGEMNINVSNNAEIISEYSTGIREIGNTLGATNVVSIKISGGTVKGGTGMAAVQVRDVTKPTVSITGGTFSTDPTEFVPANSNYYVRVNADNTYTAYYSAPYIPTTPTDNVTNSGTAGTDNATTNADLSGSTTTSSGTTTATVDKTTADKIVDKAVANQSEEIVIDATANSTTDAASTTTAQVGIPTATFEAIAEKTEADVTIKTDVAEVKMDNAAATAVSEQATGDTVQIIAEKVAEETDKVEFELKVVCSDGKVISDFKGGNVAVTVALPKAMAEKKVVCVYIDDNGHMSKMEGKKNADGTYTFNTGHFSSYAILTEEEADAAIEAQKEAIRNIKIKLRSELVETKYGKKAVKVNWTVIEGNKKLDGIEIYRSTERFKGYGTKPFCTSAKGGKAGSYINTKSLENGIRYYYKVRGYILVDGQKVYTDYSTKAWRTVR